MSYISLRVMGIIMLIVLAVGNILWLRYQQRELAVLRHQNAQLMQQGEMLEARLLQLKYQATHISAALSEQKTVQQHLEKQSEQTRRQLRQAVSQSPCASLPVPDDVIRLQQNTAGSAPGSR
ncbi:DUF2570 family protein [Erwinia tasmaniensis]|uniref:DUF2570 domain-containing protein n=1 Tax=Erwinia tasmaniensis (strain DSM 17950 / CFBP 7177 / CIP 109463 / NCPPB 4357 / Et1/99) TaxID=465817 RepID=B2VJH9_ERWT9|nr:DUF2570 family protein [Erwinia tasmaniensis]CAO95591.1 hypothetical protein ETA_05450 [Erwinia tasmaniensis Et1/99]